MRIRKMGSAPIFLTATAATTTNVPSPVHTAWLYEVEYSPLL
jgi:hypothetical protein